jgi:hypothetical protein
MGKSEFCKIEVFVPCLLQFKRFWWITNSSQISHFPIKISIKYRVLSKSLPGTVFRGSRGRSCLHRAVLMPFSIFGISKKGTKAFHFRLKGRQLATPPNAGTCPGSDLAPNDAPKFIFTYCSLFLFHFGPFLRGFSPDFGSASVRFSQIVPGNRTGSVRGTSLARPATRNGPRTPRDQMFIDFGPISDGCWLNCA